MKKQDSNRSKRTVKTQKGYAGDSVHTLKQVEQGKFIYCSKKNLVNKMKIFKGPLFLEGLFYSALSSTHPKMFY
ncbi:hypothetical protein ACT7DC_16685 [Bacillus cereus]